MDAQTKTYRVCWALYPFWAAFAFLIVLATILGVGGQRRSYLPEIAVITMLPIMLTSKLSIEPDRLYMRWLFIEKSLRWDEIRSVSFVQWPHKSYYKFSSDADSIMVGGWVYGRRRALLDALRHVGPDTAVDDKILTLAETKEPPLSAAWLPAFLLFLTALLAAVVGVPAYRFLFLRH